MISFAVSETTEALRADFERWLKDNPPPLAKQKVELDEFVEVGAKWQHKLAEDRWVGVHWPEEYGGRGLSLVEEAVLQETLAAHRSPQLVGLFGLTMVGPVLIEYGSDAQKARFLSKILSAEEIWCQGFSEPGAGSDLAAVATTATNNGSDWQLNGQKVWTSFAQYAQWCFLLARSSKQEKKHRGLSYFLVPMSSEGISVRPLTQISGDSEFNEIFFENTPVASEYMVGAEGDGWKMAISTLMHERVILTFSRHLQSEVALQEIADLLKEDGTEAQVARFGELCAQMMAVRTLAFSHLMNYSGGSSPGPEGSMDKLFWSETFQEICKLALEVLGPEGLLESGNESVLDGLHLHRYLYSRGRTIAAGTSEIQRSIIAERVLGLPRG